MTHQSLFDEPQDPMVITVEGYAVAFRADLLFETAEEPQWELDTDAIYETREAAEQSMAEWCDGAPWKVVKVTIVTEEFKPTEPTR